MAQVFQDAACTRCGCVCDDLALHVESGRIVAAERACALGEPWLLGQTAEHESPVKVNGAPASFDEAVGRAAEILSLSRAPLIYGLSTSSTSGQRAAVELAETLGATIEPAASTLEAATILALQSVGASTATLGEVRNRADLVIYWGSNPQVSHPRHFERCVEAEGLFVPGGRRGRHVIVVDIERTATAELADRFVQVEPGGDSHLITALRAVLKGEDSPAAPIGGVAWEEILTLAEQLKSCGYGAVFFGSGLARHTAPQAAVAALFELVTELNSHTRFVAQPMHSCGATNVLTWLTGFPMSVNFALGYPRYNPAEYSAEVLLERGAVDAVVLVGTEGVARLSPATRQTLARLPVISLESPTESCPIPAAVSFTTAVYGVHRRGTAYRMDGVPIPLRAVLDSSLPSDAEVLMAINEVCADETSRLAI